MTMAGRLPLQIAFSSAVYFIPFIGQLSVLGKFGLILDLAEFTPLPVTGAILLLKTKENKIHEPPIATMNNPIKAIIIFPFSFRNICVLFCIFYHFLLFLR